ncbi:hypothetical protein OHB54_02870 [Streptomyces sp. NBC_01007]|nr:hypothetical protein OHB54_02870 [Streptomyces sp. NBC_01007]
MDRYRDGGIAAGGKAPTGPRLLQTAGALPGHEHPDAVKERQTLVNVGEVKAVPA